MAESVQLLLDVTIGTISIQNLLVVVAVSGPPLSCYRYEGLDVPLGTNPIPGIPGRSCTLGACTTATPD